MTLPAVADHFRGYLSFEVSQQEFYIQHSVNSDLIIKTMEKVLEEATTNKQLKKPVVGQACLAKYIDDNGWYRAQVKDLRDDEAEVLFVDYGNSSLVSFSDILEISAGLAATCALATKCCIINKDASVNLTEWAGEGNVLLQYFYVLLIGFCFIFLNLVSQTENISFVLDELIVDVVSIQHTTCNVNLQKSDGSSFGRSSSGPASSEKNSVQSTHEGDISAAPSKASSVHSSPLRVESQPCRKFPPQPLYSPELVGYLTFEVSQQEFYIQLTAESELLEKLTSSVQAESTSNKQLVNPVVGQSCIAMFSEDESWYRAKILGHNDQQVQVFFVDFGNSSFVDCKHVLEISEDLSSTHPLAVPCRLLTPDASKNLSEWAQGVCYRL